MKIWVPINTDQNHEIMGLFSLFTSEGNVIFLFSNPLKRDGFLKNVAQKLTEGKIGHIGLDATSFNDAARQLLAMDPSLAGNAVFLSDSDPMFDEYFELTKQMTSI